MISNEKKLSVLEFAQYYSDPYFWESTWEYEMNCCPEHSYFNDFINNGGYDLCKPFYALMVVSLLKLESEGLCPAFSKNLSDMQDMSTLFTRDDWNEVPEYEVLEQALLAALETYGWSLPDDYNLSYYEGDAYADNFSLLSSEFKEGYLRHCGAEIADDIGEKQLDNLFSENFFYDEYNIVVFRNDRYERVIREFSRLKNISSLDLATQNLYNRLVDVRSILTSRDALPAEDDSFELADGTRIEVSYVLPLIENDYYSTTHNYPLCTFISIADLLDVLPKLEKLVEQAEVVLGIANNCADNTSLLPLIQNISAIA